jgi:6-phosphogluconate dehydrogenase, decarboxylating
MEAGNPGAQAEIGLVGLGVMGSNLALNIAEKGFRIAVYNRPEDRPKDFPASAGELLASRIISCNTLEELVAAIKPPRPVILMVTAGRAVDTQVTELRPLLSSNDIIIDAGNSYFQNTTRWFAGLKNNGLNYVGMGVSGGEEGARHGPSIMFGGAPEAYTRVEPILTAIAAKYNGDPCCAYLGTGAAGHFVKMVHNGIEYADMQMIAEIYGLMRDGLKLEAVEIGSVFRHWNTGRLNSYLIEITATVLDSRDPKTGKPIVDLILDKAEQKGTGQWSVTTAQTLGVPANTLEEAVAARILSSWKAERVAASAIYGTSENGFTMGDSRAFIDQLELALLAGKVCAYAQGFSLMDNGSKRYGWQLPLATIARIWRAGCIIRSQFLDTIMASLEQKPDLANLLVAPSFVDIMRQSVPALRSVVAKAALAGIPVPALSAALGYFESYRHESGVANLIQAQRDFFGAHGFERIDAPGISHQHGPWSSKPV